MSLLGIGDWGLGDEGDEGDEGKRVTNTQLPITHYQMTNDK
ncbi:hypothetical protein [Tolypothrix sp. LEGE 11397]|nr:hypothetical protein [Tolypothrix sp. LEGE 11397]